MDAAPDLARAAPPRPGTSSVEDRVLLARVEGQYAKLPAAILANLPLVLAAAWALGGEGAGGLAWAWVGATCLLLPIRLGQWLHYRRRRPVDRAGALRWARLAAAGTLLSGLAWGAGVAALYPRAETPARLFVTVLLAGAVAGSAGTLGDLLAAFVAFAVPACLPGLVIMARSPSPLERLVAPLGVAYLGAITALAWSTGRRHASSLRYRFQNEQLVEGLTAAQDRLAALNASLEARVQERGERLARMERQLAQAALLASVGGLAASLAHELNNPLAGLLGNLRYVEEELARLAPSGQGEGREALADARAAAERVRETVRSLSAVAAADAGGPLALRDTLEACATVAAGELRARVTLLRDLGEVPPVRADAPGLAQVCLQLLLETARSVPAGEPAAWQLRLRTRHDAARREALVELEVEPAGPPAPRPEGGGAAPPPDLALAREVLHRLGGELEALAGPPAAHLRVRLPLA